MRSFGRSDVVIIEGGYRAFRSTAIPAKSPQSRKAVRIGRWRRQWSARQLMCSKVSSRSCSDAAIQVLRRNRITQRRYRSANPSRYRTYTFLPCDRTCRTKSGLAVKCEGFFRLQGRHRKGVARCRGGVIKKRGLSCDRSTRSRCPM